MKFTKLFFNYLWLELHGLPEAKVFEWINYYIFHQWEIKVTFTNERYWIIIR